MTDKNAWGARPEDWQKLIDLGLVEDLLPVVSNPGAPISPNSTMKSLGKTPSVYNREGYVVGLGQWTEKTATPDEVARWSKQSDYGICVQTRHLRALDIDISDPELVARITTMFYEWQGLTPCRNRDNSPKVLLPFWFDGDLTKRVIKTDHGNIELLARGQQFIFAGTHPSKARYQIDWNGQRDFVTIETLDRVNALWAALELEFGNGESFTSKGGKRNAKQNNSTTGDETLAALEEKGFIIGYGQEGQGFIECPFKEQHSTESTISSTAYFPRGSRGYDRGHFVCLHASCQSNKRDEDYLDAFGLRADDFECIATTSSVGTESADLIVAEIEDGVALDLPPWARTKNGEPLATLYNIRRALERNDVIGYDIAYDGFRDEILIRRAGRSWQPFADEHAVEIRERLEAMYLFKPVGRELMRDAILKHAKRNRIDTAIEWLNAQAWDGVSRIANFAHVYLGAVDTPYTRAVSMYMWTALAGRVLDPGCKADMAPILKGPQGFRKSTAIAALAPTPEQFVELDFAEKEDNLSRKMRGALVAELPELRGLRTRELESIKAFMARQHEKWIPKFREFGTTFPRRLLFFGTTNEDQFLADASGHRRWLPFDVHRRCDTAAIRRDLKQLWAEARDVYSVMGLLWEDAERLAPVEHEQYVIQDSIVDVISDWLYKVEELDGEEERRPIDRPYLRTVDVAREALGMDVRQLKRVDEMRIGDALKALGYKQGRQRESGKQFRAWCRDQA